MKNRARHYRWLERSCYILIICLVVTALSAAQAQVSERLESPSGKYSIAVARAAKNSLVVSKGTEIVARISTQVGPVDSLFEALWSADGKYVAVNKQRSSRPGGDYMFIFGLPQGKVLRKPDDALWTELEGKASAFIDEKHLTETGGKVFLTLTATEWEKDRLRLKLEAWLSELEDGYLFEGTINPSDLKIHDWKVSKVKS